MKLSPNSAVPINALKGALLTNAHGAEFRLVDVVASISVNNSIQFMVQLNEYDGEGELMEGTVGVPLTSLNDWEIQLQPNP